MKKQAFTLIEILVASTIIIILMSIGVVSFRAASQNARNSKRAADMEAVRQAMVLYRAHNGSYPTGTFSNVTSTSNLRTTTSPGPYLSGPQPFDPSTKAVYSLGTATSTAFCYCAVMEGTGKGNASGVSGTTCSYTNTPASQTHYCVSNP